MAKKEKEVFQISVKDGKIKYLIEGSNALKHMDILMNVNVMLLTRLLNVKEDTSPQDKFSLIDTWLGALKEQLEQAIVFNNS